ncbi:hypothetical protein [Frankia sp. R82]|uniref:hypothetical protein n=1 Tax=Frankia sp. R82 TaxID=2950553 RepID=UPI002043498E|nr:hypothetical protein [Frankia sp. R82]MCM3886784.1 hypothetical protein [Frankia sp. R82]
MTGIRTIMIVDPNTTASMTEAALATAAILTSGFTVVTAPPRTREQSHRVLRHTGPTGPARSPSTHPSPPCTAGRGTW